MESLGYVYGEFDSDLRDTPGSGGEAFKSDAYRLGRLVAIDLVDLMREEVVWHGSAEGRLAPAMLRDAGSAAEQAVAAAFQGLPIQPLGRTKR